MPDLFDDQAKRRPTADGGWKKVYEDEPTDRLPDGRHDGSGDLSKSALDDKPWGAMTRREKVLRVLYRSGTLTQKEAYEKIGTTRLAARIHELREADDAPPIEKQMITVDARDGDAQVAQYYIPQVNQ